MNRFIDKIGLRHVLFCAMIAVVLRATFHAIPTADLWWYLAMGRFIISTHTFPLENIFSYTAPQFPMVDHEWIPELVFLRLYLSGGFPWLYAFKSLMILGTFLVMHALARRKGVPSELCSLAVMISIVFAKGALYFDIRPYIFTYLFVALLLFILEDYRERKKAKTLAALPVLSLIWVNSHGGFILFFAVMALYFIAEASNVISLEKKGAARWSSLLPLGTAGLVSLLLSLVNPYGLKLLVYPFSFFGSSFFKANLLEWQPPRLLGADWPFLLFLIVLALSMVLNVRKIRLFEGLAFLLFSYLALTAVRQITIFCIVAIPFTAILLERLYAELSKIKAMNPHHVSFFAGWRRTCALLASFLALFFMAYRSFFPIDYRNLSMEHALFPVYGMEFIKANHVTQPLFNPYEWGGYMLWKLYPPYRVFIDGRANTSYPEEVYRESLMVMFGEKGWEEILDRYEVKSVLCNKYLMEKNPRYRLGHILGSDRRWVLLYEDRVEMLYLRICPENEDLISKHREGRLLIPRSAYVLRAEAMKFLKEKKNGEAREKIREALGEDSSYEQLYVDMGYICYASKDFKEGEKILKAGLKRDSTLFLAHDLLGRIYQEEGDTWKAEREYREALRINPEFINAREALQRLEGVKDR
jgi:hypothetical protein